jgi:AraC-like DNA-binding protein
MNDSTDIATPFLPIDPRALTGSLVVDVTDPGEMDSRSSVTARLGPEVSTLSYRLLDGELMRARFRDPIARITTRDLGGMSICYVGGRFATRSAIDGDGMDRYYLGMMLHGRKTFIYNGYETTAEVVNGLIYRASPGSTGFTSDDSAWRNLWIEASAVERPLEAMLDHRLREPLEFWPGIDWTSGLAASRRAQIDFLVQDTARPGGAADNPVALAAVKDLIVTLMLRGPSHNYLERLENGCDGAVPAYVRRAEEFMHANAEIPIRIELVARAAGGGVSTLGAVFLQFRDTTPLATLHDIRLQHVRNALRVAGGEDATKTIAQRFGFTNPSRFIAAYGRRFGEHPNETRRRVAR